MSVLFYMHYVYRGMPTCVKNDMLIFTEHLFFMKKLEEKRGKLRRSRRSRNVFVHACINMCVCVCVCACVCVCVCVCVSDSKRTKIEVIFKRE